VYTVPDTAGGESLEGPLDTGGAVVADGTGCDEDATGGSDACGEQGWPGWHGATGGAGWLKKTMTAASSASASRTPTKTATILPEPNFAPVGGGGPP
jgi:hypothetical protein